MITASNPSRNEAQIKNLGTGPYVGNFVPLRQCAKDVLVGMLPLHRTRSRACASKRFGIPIPLGHGPGCIRAVRTWPEASDDDLRSHVGNWGISGLMLALNARTEFCRF